MRRVDIFRESVGEGVVRYNAVMTGDDSAFNDLFATTSFREVAEHYVLSRHRASIHSPGSSFYLRDEIVTGGTATGTADREKQLSRLEQPFDVQHDYDSANAKAHKEILKIVAGREGRRRWMTVRDHTTSSKRPKIISKNL